MRGGLDAHVSQHGGGRVSRDAQRVLTGSGGLAQTFGVIAGQGGFLRGTHLRSRREDVFDDLRRVERDLVARPDGERRTPTAVDRGRGLRLAGILELVLQTHPDERELLWAGTRELAPSPLERLTLTVDGRHAPSDDASARRAREAETGHPDDLALTSLTPPPNVPTGAWRYPRSS